MSTIERDRPGVGAGPPGPGIDPIPETVIRPSRGWIGIDWRELAQSRELFDTLMMRDIRVRYKQTVLGVGWAVLQPLLSMVVFTFVFGRFPGIKDPTVPYPLIVFAGMVPWLFFSNAVSGAGLSLLNQQQLITKIYFPRLYVPASTVGAFGVDLLIGLALFVFLMPIYSFVPSRWVVVLPLVVAVNFAAALGLGLALAALTVLYRDLRFIIPFGLQILMFASTVFYSATVVPTPARYVLALNPMVGVIGAYRSSILGMPWDPATLAVSSASAAALLVFGLFYFRRTERLFADLA